MNATTSPRTRAEAKADTRRRVLAAAETIFRREGFHGASLDQVAREAGFTKGAVYSQFHSKADLFFALLDARTQRRMADMSAVRAAHADPERFVRAYARDIAREIAAETDWWAVVIEFMTVVARDAALRERYAAHHDRSRERIAADMARDAERLGVRLRIDPVRLATAVLATTNGLTLERLISPGRVDDALYEDVHAALLRSFLPADPEESLR